MAGSLPTPPMRPGHHSHKAVVNRGRIWGQLNQRIDQVRLAAVVYSVASMSLWNYCVRTYNKVNKHLTQIRNRPQRHINTRFQRWNDGLRDRCCLFYRVWGVWGWASPSTQVRRAERLLTSGSFCHRNSPVLRHWPGSTHTHTHSNSTQTHRYLCTSRTHIHILQLHTHTHLCPSHLDAELLSVITGLFWHPASLSAASENDRHHSQTKLCTYYSTKEQCCAIKQNKCHKVS